MSKWWLLTTGHRVRALRRKHLERTFDAYLNWREACHGVEAAYRCWVGASSADAISAFRWYTVTLDREERAAAVYAGLIQSVGQPVSKPAGPAPPRGTCPQKAPR
jgi:hypothetical protein